MPELPELPGGSSELMRGARRGVGFAVGVGVVVTVASLLRDGGRQTAKQLIRGGLRGRDALAELGEQVQDLYAEVQAEQRAGEPSS